MKTGNFSRIATSIIVCALFAGCATGSSIPHYMPQGDAKARLRVALSKGQVPQSAAGDGMTAFLHTNAECTAPNVLGAVYNLDDGPKKHDASRSNHNRAGALNMPLGEYTKLEVKEMLIDAGKGQDIALQFGVLLAGPFGAFTRCNIVLKQDFEAGRDYEIVGRFDTPTSCSAVVNELVAEDQGVTRQQIASVNNVDNPLSPACFVKY